MDGPPAVHVPFGVLALGPMPDDSRVFSALLRYWRQRRGMSQLDLALAADVSSRHVSFLETGRSRPSLDMVLHLAAVLDVPLREQNVMAREAGFDPVFAEPALDAMGDPGIEHALTMLMRHHEPYPMLVLDHAYEVLRLNDAARRMTVAALGAVPEPMNAMRVFFDPEGFRPFLADWEAVARIGIARLHREVLRSPHDERLAALLDEVLAAPDVPTEWRTADLAHGSEAAFHLRFEFGGLTLSFVTTMMRFHAPQNVTLEEIQVESFVPSDAATAQACAVAFGPSASG